MPFIVQPPSKPAPVHDYSYYQDSRAPFLGTASLRSEDEYVEQTQTVRKFGCGCFDTTKPDEQHYGRTLSQIMALTSLGEFEILRWETIVRGSEIHKPRVYYEIAWYEKTDVDKLAIPDYARELRQDPQKAVGQPTAAR